MKKYLFALMILLSHYIVAQNTEEKAFMNSVKPYNDSILNAQKSKDYKTMIFFCKEALNKFEKANHYIRSQYSSIEKNLYYCITCCESLQNNKKEAISAFQKAIQKGYIEYSEASQDHDLDNIRNEKQFKSLLATIREKGDFVVILRKAKGYKKVNTQTFPVFTYMDSSDVNLRKVRLYFNLDSIAGTGDEISKIKNILFWVHNVVRHDGSSDNPELKNAIDLVDICKREKRGVNCRMMATILNECYLSMGFKSRFVTCLPCNPNDTDCHVINIVYSHTRNKWIWVDPTFNAYVTDNKGDMLSIEEVREKIIKNKPLIINKEANWNNINQETKEHYLDVYMAKNLYYFSCSVRSEFNCETSVKNKIRSDYVYLIPKGFHSKKLNEYKTTNNQYFWQSPGS